ASAGMSGGIRRAAMICLFDKEDIFMKKCKSGNWFEDNPQRAYANNSAVFDRNEMQEDEFKNFWNDTKENGTGEPGVYLTNDKDIGVNPCFSYETKILTDSGYKEIGSLDGKNVKLSNINGEIVDGRVYKSGHKDIVKINLSNRKHIRCTPDNVFMTNEGDSVKDKDLKGE